MEKKPGYIFQASMQIGDAIQLSVHGNFPEGSTSEDMGIEMDKVFQAMEKQNLKRMKLPTVQGGLRDQKDALSRAKDQCEKLLARQQDSKLNSAEKTALDQCKDQILRLETAIERGEEIVAALEKEAA